MSEYTVMIVTGKCSSTKRGFGIRFESKKNREWVATWCFAINDEVAKREGYEKTKISGNFSFADEFPGCPHCSSEGFFLCTCDKLGCWNRESNKVVCPSCNQKVELAGDITDLVAGSDR